MAAVMGATGVMRANPTDGVVTSGAAVINTALGVVTVNQATDKAIINWQSFSIGAGELTKFVQPSSASATLNRVLGGQTSIINGTLSANGQVYLLNGNGVLIGPGGVVNSGGFLASTRNLTDSDFNSGNLHFTGSGDGGVTNLGTVNALGGNVIFIGKTVDNQGEITAPDGHVGLAAADDVMISQAGLEHVFVRSTPDATSASGQTAVNNSGTVLAASAELKAANGNIYALATNNSGIIRATGVTTEGGHIWLIAEGNHGTTQNTGTLAARGVNGKGGDIETSGGHVVALGTVDAGQGGTWLIDPSDITINAGTAATIVATLNGGTTVTEDSTLGAGGNGDITVAAPINWSGTGTLNLFAYRNLNINAAITGNNGGLAVKSALGGSGVIAVPAAVSVKNFDLQGGAWMQAPAGVPAAFSATNFMITSGSFLRSQGGSGTAADPYQLVDVYGLQGIGTSAANLAATWRVTGAINAAGASGWNSGAGFAPIAGFTGTFNGNGAAISGLFINRPAATNVGLFASVGAGGSIGNTTLTGVNVTGLANVGGLVGNNAGMITTSNVTGTVKGTNSATSFNIGGLAGGSSGAIDSSFVTTNVTGYGNTGGLVGNNSGALNSSYSTGAVASFLNASPAGSNLGGLVGLNNGGTIALGYTTGSVNAPDTAQVGGLVGSSTGASAAILQSYARGSSITGYSQVGGLVGNNGAAAAIVGSRLIDGVGTAGVTGTLDVGGLVGSNAGSITQSFVLSAGSVLGKDGAATAARIGGFVGTNSGTVTSSTVNLAVGQAVGTTDTQKVGGFVGWNTASGSLTGVAATGNVAGFLNVGGLAGQNDGALGIQSNASGTVTGNTSVGGLVGGNTGTVAAQSYATGAVSGVTNVGGLLGLNNTPVAIAGVYASGAVTGTSFVGGLVGANTSGDFSASSAAGAVTGTGTNIGGLMGQSGAILSGTTASGSVSANGASNVGGLVGNNSGTIFSKSSASGAVVGGTAVGGLVGNNSGTIGDALTTVNALEDYTHATGTVTGLSLVGGLVGDNSGTVRQSSASAAVNGSSTASSAVGGLVGRNGSAGTIAVSFSGSTVYGNGTGSTNGAATDTQVGGLVGLNLGAINQSYATGAVVGDSNTGGLVGLNNAAGALVQTSYATGNVTGLTATGGLVGYNQLGTIKQNYSTAVVVGTNNVGGLVGFNGGTVAEDYATGTVNGTGNVGGLIGQIAASGTLTQSYATGAVTSAGVSGGLAGLNSGTVSGSFWDADSTNKGATGIGGGTTTGAVGLTSTGGSPTAFSSASYSGFGTAGSVAAGAANAVQFTDSVPAIVWYMLEGSTRPYLAWEAPINNLQSGGAYLVYTAHQLQLLTVNLGAAYTLGKGIDLAETQQASGLWNTGQGFVPIGTASRPFTGSLGGGVAGITNLYINTPGLSNVGLFGASTGSLSGISLSGNVTGLNQVGLLVGLNQGQVSGARLMGAVTGQTNVGGLAGENTSTIQSTAVNVTTNGATNVGGLAGYNNGGTLQTSYSLGAVNGTGATQSALGGLAGLNSGTITIAYATGAVTGNATSMDVGGAIGRDSGAIDQTYATGAVNGGTQVGGLAGSVASGATILQSYATGTVNGTSRVGGIAGSLESGGSVSRSYASGVVTGTNAATTGGLLGQVAAGGTYANLFWDHTKSTTAVGTDGSPGLITELNGKTINGNTGSYTGLDASGTPGFTTGFGSSALVYGSADSVWRVQTGSMFPFLTQLSTQVSGTSYTTKAHTTAAAGATVTLNSGGNLLATTTTNGAGAFDFLFAADDGLFNYLPQTGKTLRIADSVHNADSIAAKNFSGNGVPNLLANITPADTWGDTVRVVSSGLDNKLLAAAGSAFITTPEVNPFGGTNLLISENFDVASGLSGYGISGDLTARGDVTFDSPGQVPASFTHPVVLNAAASPGNLTPTFTLNAPLSSTAFNRAIVVQSDGNFVNPTLGAGAFTTPNGTYIVYSQNPAGSGQSVVDNDGGLNQLHLYGTNYTQTPAYLLSPGLNYQIYSFTPTLTLQAVAVGSAAGSLTLQYGTSTPGLTYTVSGLLAGDTVAPGATFNQVLSNQPGAQTTYAKYAGLGNYPVTFTGSTLPTSLIGYNLVFTPGNITVTQNTSNVDLTVSGAQPFGYIGGGSTFAYTANGAVAGDPNFNPTFNTTIGQFANVNRNGGGAVIPYLNTINFNPASLSNYANITITTIDQGFTVTPAALTVSATGTSIYGNTVAAPTLTGSSAAPAGTIYDNSGTGSTVAISSLGYTTTPLVTTASHVGSYGITVAGTSGTSTSGVLSNYDVTITPGTYAVTPRALVIDATQNEQHVYDGTPGPTTFGSTDYAVGATAPGTGLVNGDQVTGLMGRVSNTNPNVGHYNYTVGTLGTADSGSVASSDYTLTFSAHGFGLDITPRAITIGTLSNETKVYGNADPNTNLAGTIYDITAGTMAVGESFASIGALGRQAGESVNGGTPYLFNSAGTVGIVNAGNASTTSNYTISFTNLGGYGLTITPAPLTVTANNATKVYNALPYSGGNGVAYSGFKFSDNAGSLGGTIAYSGTSQGAINVGSYVLSASGLASGNYTFSYVDGALAITRAQLTVTADAQSKTYGGLDPTLTFTPTGTLYGADTYAVISGVSLSTTTGAAATAGTHAIIPTGGTASNYAITNVNGTLTVAKATLTATADAQAKTYGGAEPTLTYTPSGILFYSDTYGVISGVSLSTTTGAAATAGTHVITASGGTAANYTIIDVNNTLTVAKAALLATADNKTTTYGTNATLTYTVSGPLFYGDTAGVVSGVSLATTTGPSAVVGMYAITATGGTASNYNVTDADGMLTVNKATLNLTADNQSKTYGGADPTLTFTPGGTLFYGDTYGVIDTSGVGLATTTGAAATAGTHAITITGGAAANYNVVDVNGTLTVAKATLTATANDQSKTYGGLDPTLTFTSSGTLFYSDTYAVISGVGPSTMTGAAATAGTHVITASGGTAANYNIVDANGTLTVAKAALLATADNQAKIYGAAEPTLTYSVSGPLFYSDTASVVSGVSLSTTTGAAATAGTHTITATGGTAANYTISDANGTLTVGKATLTATADNQAKIYGAAEPILTYSVSGPLFYGDTASVVSGVGLATTTGAAATAGTHAITTTGGTASNYNVVDADGTLTVGKATLTATADAQSKTYGGIDPTLTYTASGTLFYGDNYGVISGVGLSTTTGAAATAGTHTITATGGTASNYNVVDANGTLTVAKAALLATADDQGKTYGGIEPTLTYTVSGPLFYGDTAGVVSGVSLSTTTGAAATAGTHTITASGGTAANYTISDANGTLTVGKATLTATADNQNKTYGAAEPTLTYTASGTLFYGDNYGVISGVGLLTTTGAAATAGAHTIAASGGTAANYNVVDANGTLTVNKAPLTVTADNQTTTYGTNATLTYTASGPLFYGDNYGVISGVGLSTTTGPSAVVGTYAINATGGTASNYAITDVNGLLTVGKATLFATADNQSKTYGGIEPTLTYTVSGPLYYGDSAGVVSGVGLNTSTGAAATAGTHVITAAGGTATNYNVVDVNGTLSVAQAPITVTAHDQSKTYGAVDPTLTYSVGGTLYYGDVVNLITDVNLSTTSGAAATAGTHVIAVNTTGPTAANYVVVNVPGTLTVAKAALTVTAGNQSKTYGGIDPTLTYTVSGPYFYGDNAGVVSGVNLSTPTGLNATAGTHVITAAGGTAANYNLTDGNGLLTVAQAPLTITADPQSKFSGLTFVFNGTEFTTSGLFGSDSVAHVGLTSPATPSLALPGSYDISVTPNSATGAGLANYGISFAPGTFTVVPGSLSQLPISWDTRSRLNQLIGGLFNTGYGEKRFYELEVPGMLRRVVPSDLVGIGTGSSLVDVKIGLETVYSLDRFQSFRH